MQTISCARKHYHDLLVRSNILGLCFPDSVKEPVCKGRHGYFTTQNAVRGNVVAVDGFRGILIAANIGAGQSKSGKGALGPLVSENLGIELPVGIGGGMASHRSGCRRGVPAKLKLA